jgi:hypothetical protein
VENKQFCHPILNKFFFNTVRGELRKKMQQFVINKTKIVITFAEINPISVTETGFYFKMV